MKTQTIRGQSIAILLAMAVVLVLFLLWFALFMALAIADYSIEANTLLFGSWGFMSIYELYKRQSQWRQSRRTDWLMAVRIVVCSIYLFSCVRALEWAARKLGALNTA
jgi:hypothetical protein